MRGGGALGHNGWPSLLSALSRRRHWLGGGIGLLASANLLAAVEGDGLLEVDVNENPLREEIAPLEIADGRVRLPERTGLGVIELPRSLERYRTYHGVRRAGGAGARDRLGE